MIKINLLSEAKPAKKKRGVSALGGAGRLNLFLILGGLLLGLLVVGVQWWVESSRLKEQEEKNRLAQQEVTRLEAVLKEVGGLRGQEGQAPEEGRPHQLAQGEPARSGPADGRGLQRPPGPPLARADGAQRAT